MVDNFTRQLSFNIPTSVKGVKAHILPAQSGPFPALFSSETATLRHTKNHLDYYCQEDRRHGAARPTLIQPNVFPEQGRLTQKGRRGANVKPALEQSPDGH